MNDEGGDRGNDKDKGVWFKDKKNMAGIDEVKQKIDSN